MLLWQAFNTFDFKLTGSFRFDYEYEYDYEIRHFWRQLLASSRADVIKS